MDKKMGSFIKYSSVIVLLIITLIAFLTYVYRSFSLTAYNRLLLILILMSIIIMIVVVSTVIAVSMAGMKKKISPLLLLPVRIGMKIILPFAIFVTGIFKGDSDAIRGLFIDINNIFVQSGMYDLKPGQIMLLLPHCLQNSECVFKITGDINNCRQCGKCTIGPILEMVREKGIRAAVVTGGTAARNLVAREKPGMLLSVACEHDLAIGISDVGKIPVIGVVNKRPNGPCLNTTVDVGLLRQKLDNLLEHGKGE